ncbi:MAG TPA: trypsin-like serine protease, partial [Deltaproteobacteria bacterium]|nr:trypsin-like serine protease [Deltaproteobacteria bacterium]
MSPCSSSFPFPLRPWRPPGPARVWIGIVLLLISGIPRDASAVLISTGDGTGNTTPPSADPGFDNVGVVNGLSGVYVRNGWVLTANHVGEHPILLLGTLYDPVPGSSVRIQNPDASFADLLAFKIRGPKPPLPDLALASAAPSVGTLLTIIGNGRNRGTATSWMGLSGWNWGPGSTLRWGTNKISEIGQNTFATEAFHIVFDALPPGQAMGQHEADVVNGDSGGGAFIGSGPSAELVGILFARATFTDQPPSTSLAGTGGVGNVGIISDLFFYRNAIESLIDQPDCADGLDDDGDGLTDFPDDPGCTDALDPDERGAIFECDNGIDDDGDGLTDFPDDDGCLHPTNPIEAPEPDATIMLE